MFTFQFLNDKILPKLYIPSSTLNIDLVAYTKISSTNMPTSLEYHKLKLNNCYCSTQCQCKLIPYAILLCSAISSCTKNGFYTALSSLLFFSLFLKNSIVSKTFKPDALLPLSLSTFKVIVLFIRHLYRVPHGKVDILRWLPWVEICKSDFV